jgi:hypothetical protein
MYLYLVKNKTIKTIVLLIAKKTVFLYPKGDERQQDKLYLKALNPQLKNLKQLKFIQVTKIPEEEIDFESEEFLSIRYIDNSIEE